MYCLCWILAAVTVSLFQPATSGTCQYSNVTTAAGEKIPVFLSCPDECKCQAQEDGPGCKDCSCSCPNDSVVPFWAWFIIIPGLILILIIAVVAFCCVLRNTIGSIL